MRSNQLSVWDELFKRGEFRWREPHEKVVGLVGTLRERGVHRVLDLGCGAGRHLIYLSQQGFQVHGIDIAETGLKHARRWLEEEGHTARLAMGDIARLPYAGGSFEALLSLYVIYHSTLDRMREAISEIHRVLQPGGLGLVTFLSTRSDRYGQGEEIAPNTFITSSGADSGTPHHFSDRAEVEELLADFARFEIELAETVDHGHRHSHWQVLIER